MVRAGPSHSIRLTKKVKVQFNANIAVSTTGASSSLIQNKSFIFTQGKPSQFRSFVFDKRNTINKYKNNIGNERMLSFRMILNVLQIVRNIYIYI